MEAALARVSLLPYSSTGGQQVEEPVWILDWKSR